MGSLPPRPVGHRRPHTVRGSLAVRARVGERGAVMVMVALSMTIIVTCTALTVDLGRVSVLRRDLQNVADAAALDLARALDGETVASALLASSTWQGVVEATLARNDFVRGGERAVEIAVGDYDPVEDEFRVYASDPVAPVDVVTEVPPSAVRVRVFDRVDYAFAPGGNTTSRAAVATRSDPIAGIQIGSFAARLNSDQSVILNRLLGDAIGATAVGYDGLAGAGVALGDLATELRLGSAEELLDTQVALGDLIDAQAALLERQGDTVRANLLRQILAANVPTAEVRLGDALAVFAGAADMAASIPIDVLDILTASVLVADGDHFLSIPGLDLGVTGVVGLETGLTVVEPPQWAFGPVGTTVHTAQVELDTTLRLLSSLAGVADINVSVGAAVAPSAAEVGPISCGDPNTMQIDVRTGLVELSLEITARVLGIPVTLTGDIGRSPQGLPVDFSFPPDVFGEGREVPAPGLGLGDIDLEVTVLGLDLGVSALVGSALRPLVANLVVALDAVLVSPLLSLLGVTAPGADVTPLGIECGGLKLVA